MISMGRKDVVSIIAVVVLLEVRVAQGEGGQGGQGTCTPVYVRVFVVTEYLSLLLLLLLFASSLVAN